MQQQKRSSDLGSHAGGGGDLEWVAVQKKTFTRWANTYLGKRKLAIVELTEDLKDGIKLAALLEVISRENVGKINPTPKMEIHMLENLNKSLEFMKNKKLALVNIGSQDIFKSNEKLILGLLWTIILRFEVGDQSKAGLLLWVQKCCKGYKDVDPPNVQNFTGDWNTGLPFCAIIHHFRPDLLDYNKLSRADAAGNCELAFRVAEEKLGISRLLDVQDVANNPNPDEKSIIAYVSQFFKLFAQLGKTDALLKSIRNAVEVTKRHDAWQTKYDASSSEILKWTGAKVASLSAPLTANTTAGVKVEIDAFSKYIRTERPEKQALKTEAEAVAAQLLNSKRNNKRPDFKPLVPVSKITESWEALLEAEKNREKDLIETYNRFQQCDVSSSRFTSRSKPISSWLDDRSEHFQQGVSSSLSLTQIESELEVHEGFETRLKQNQQVIAQLAQVETEIVQLSQGKHASQADVTRGLADLKSKSTSCETAGKAHKQALDQALLAEKDALTSERKLVRTLDALDFDLDQLETRANETLFVASAADASVAKSANETLLKELATQKSKLDGEISELAKKIAARRPQYPERVAQDKARAQQIEQAIKSRETAIASKLQEETKRDTLREKFATGANKLDSDLTKATSDLGAVSGKLEDQVKAVRAVKDRALGPLKSDLETIDALAKDCDAAQIVSNPKTPHTAFSLRATHDELIKAADNEETSLQAQILAKNALDVSPERVKELQDVFRHFDQDNTGIIELEELKEACMASGIDLADDAIEKRMRDKSPNMKFTIDDFTSFMLNEMKTGDTHEDVVNAFVQLAGDEKATNLTPAQIDGHFQTEPELCSYVKTNMPDGDFKKFSAKLFSR